MDSMRDFFRRIKDRPAIFLLMMLFAFLFSAAEAYNPIIRSYGSFSYILKHNYMEALSGWVGKAADFLKTGSSAVITIMIVLFFVLLFSMLMSLFFSGYSNILLSAVDGYPKRRREFSDGLKKNFIRVTLYFFVFTVLSAAFLVLLLYSAIPPVLMLRMFFDGNTDIIFTMLLVCILTVFVMLLSMVFYGMYFTYILPAIAGFRKSTLRNGLRMGNMYCWYLLPKTALFMFLTIALRVGLFAIHYGHRSLALSLVVFAVTSLVRTLIYYIYFYFVFNTFAAMRDDLYQNDDNVYVPDASTVKDIKKNSEAYDGGSDEEAEEYEDNEDNEDNEDYEDYDDYDDSF